MWPQAPQEHCPGGLRDSDHSGHSGHSGHSSHSGHSGHSSMEGLPRPQGSSRRDGRVSSPNSETQLKPQQERGGVPVFWDLGQQTPQPSFPPPQAAAPGEVPPASNPQPRSSFPLLNSWSAMPPSQRRAAPLSRYLKPKGKRGGDISFKVLRFQGRAQPRPAHLRALASAQTTRNEAQTTTPRPGPRLPQPACSSRALTGRLGSV